MPGFLDSFNTDGYNPNMKTPVGGNSFLDSFKDVNWLPSSNPSDGPLFNPNDKHNVTDFSHIDKDAQVTNGFFDNAWNHFKQGIDNIQIAAAIGGANHSIFGDAPQKVVDEYDNDVMKLKASLQSGVINPEQFASDKTELDERYAAAFDKVQEANRTVLSNQREVDAEPVSNEYLIKNQLTQSAGDQASLWDKIAYTGPNIVGSSASLMVPQLMATFGNNLTRIPLARLLGPVWGTVAAAGVSVAEVMYGRHNESLSEIGSTIMDAQKKMKDEYMMNHGLTSEGDIPEEELKNIRIKSRKGADMQYKENMALAANDIAQALIMPLGNFGSFGRASKGIGEALESARNYSKATRILGTGLEFAAESMLEKFEEGSQYAMQKRAEDSIYNTNMFQDKGYISNLMEDSWDTISSLNYSLIPGIDMRGKGKYSQDKEFQFSENSGGLLSALMGGIPTALSISNDLRAYKAAFKDLQDNGIVNIDGKFSRINDSILAKYFDKDFRESKGILSPGSETYHLISAIKSLSNKKDEKGNPLIDPIEAQKLVSSVQEKYELYNSIAGRIDDRINNDTRFGFGKSDELRNAIQQAKLDIFNTTNQIINLNESVPELAGKIGAQAMKESRLFGNPEYNNLQMLEAKVAALEGIKAMHLRESLENDKSNHKSANYDLEPPKVDNDLLSRHLIYLESDLADAKKEYEQEREKFGKQFNKIEKVNGYVSPSDELIKLTAQHISTDLYLTDLKEKYGKLDKIKDKKSLMDYYEATKSPLTENILDTPEPVQEEVKEEEVAPKSGSIPDERTATPENVPKTTSTSGSVDTTTSSPKSVAGMMPELLNVVDENKSDAERMAAMKQYLKGTNLALMIAPNVALDIHDTTGDTEFIKNNFLKIQDVLKMIDPNTQMYTFDPDTLSWDVVKEPTTLPDTQTETQTDDLNSDLVKSYRSGRGLQITSGLSLAGRHIEGLKTDEGWADILEDGKMVFNKTEDNHQQLANTSLISVGDKLTARVVEFPENFNSVDMSDYNYDQVKVGLYKEINVGGVKKEMLVNYLHRVEKLADLLPPKEENPNINLEAEKSLLRNARIQIIQGNADFEMEVNDKETGFLNRNAVYTTIANSIGNDTRPILSIVDRTGVPGSMGRNIMNPKGTMKSGATILLVPNETNQGTRYMPLYVVKQTLSNDPEILDIVHKSVMEYLNDTNSHPSFLNEAKKYVFISNVKGDLADLGPKGIYRNQDKATSALIIRGREYSVEKDNLDGVKGALSEVFFSISKEELGNPEYQNQLMKSPLLLTNLTPNPVVLSRFKSGEYGFLEENQQYSYFSQHTIKLGSPSLKEAVDVDTLPTVEEVVEAIVTSDPIAQTPEYIQAQLNNADKIEELLKGEDVSRTKDEEIALATKYERNTVEAATELREYGNTADEAIDALSTVYQQAIEDANNKLKILAKEKGVRPFDLQDTPEYNEIYAEVNRLNRIFDTIKEQGFLTDALKNEDLANIIADNEASIKHSIEKRGGEYVNESQVEDIEDNLLNDDFSDLEGFDMDESFNPRSSKLLISEKISGTVQNKMISSIAYQLFTTTKDVDSAVSNSDKVKAFMQTNYNEYRARLANFNKLKAAGRWDKFVEEGLKDTKVVDGQTVKKPIQDFNKLYTQHLVLVERYGLMLDNWTELVKRARVFLSERGEKINDEDDYFDTIEQEEGEEVEASQYADDGTRQRNEKEYLSKDVKRLLNFIPKIKYLIDADPKTGKMWTEAKNELNLPDFNDSNDTWSKVLGVTTGEFFDATISGITDMINSLSDESNYPVVQMFADRFKRAPEQVQKAAFKKLRLFYMRNQTLISNRKKNIIYDQESGDKVGEYFLYTSYMSASDRKQGHRSVTEEITSSMLRHKSTTGRSLFVSVFDESTRQNLLKVDTEYAKELLDEIATILDDNNNYEHYTRGKIRTKTGVLTTDAKDILYNIVKDKMGIDMNRLAFNSLLFTNSMKDGKPYENASINNTIGYILTSFSQPDKDSKYKSLGKAESTDVFENEATPINAIARAEYGYRTQRSSGAYRMDGKSYYPYVRGSYLNDFFLQFKSYQKGKGEYWLGEKSTVDNFSKDAYIIRRLVDPNETGFQKSFDLKYELGARNTESDQGAKQLKDMTPREYKITKFKTFQNSNNASGYFFFDTLSDKTTVPQPGYLKMDLSYSTEQTIDGEDIQLDEKSINALYTYVQSEINRINDVRKQNELYAKNESWRLIKNYHDRGKSEGVGKYFISMYFLNKAVLDVDNITLSRFMYNEDGSLREITDGVKSEIKKEMMKHMRKVFKNVKKDVQDNEMYDISQFGETGWAAEHPYIGDLIDHKYLSNGPRSLLFRTGIDQQLTKSQRNAIRKDGAVNRLSPEQISKIVDLAIVDYAFNYTMHTLNMFAITGDPAQAGKPIGSKAISKIKDKYKGKEGEKMVVLAHVQSTLDNLSKRNASFMAAGDVAAWDNSHYNVAIAKDISIASPELESYISYFPNNESGVRKAYEDGDLTDAQEITTVEEDLDGQLAYGVINQSQHRKALYIYDREAFNERYGGEEKISQADRTDAFKVIFQPKKPVQRTYVADETLHMSKQFYIKTSSFPLIPSMVDGAMLDLLKDMKKNKVQRVAFVSGVKQGVASEKNIFNEDGTYNGSFFDNNINNLNRNGFRIQLEVPFKEYKDEIREGTQKSKLLFVDIPQDVMMMYEGNPTSVERLSETYVDIHKEILKIHEKNLYDELGVKSQNGQIVLDRKFFKGLSDMLLREGEGRGYALNALLGLDLNEQGEFNIPLTFLPNAGQIEPVISSIVSNRLTRLKMSGKSYVQGSEFFLRTGKTKVAELKDIKDPRDIVWTKPEYASQEKLRFLRIENSQGESYVGQLDAIPPDYEIKPAQIIMPMYFIDPRSQHDGHSSRVNMDHYTVEKDNKKYIDLSKIDPELLQFNGFRIPFQGHNSAMWFEIVGFLPFEHGDLIVVPGEIAAEMGSDYDVDKLYGYLFNYYFDENNNIHKITDKVKLPEEKAKEGMTPSSLEAMNESGLRLKVLQNKLNDIEKAVLMSPNTTEAILDPLSFDTVEDTINYFGGQSTQEFLGVFNPVYQDNVKFSNNAGKLGVGVSANNNTGHAMAQVSNLIIRGQGFLFKDETGDFINDFMNVIKKANASEVSEKFEQFAAVMKTYLGDFQGSNMKYYQTELDQINKLVGMIKWTDDMKSDPKFRRFEEFITAANEAVKGEDLTAAHNSIADVVQSMISMMKVNSKEDSELTDALSMLDNPNAVTKTYSHTYIYEDGDHYVNANTSDNKGAWRLDKIWTFPDPVTGKKFKISNLISQILGVSVDNAKEQKLGAFGINEHNFNVVTSIIRGGFTLNWVYAFINQPILKEYYSAIGGTTDMYEVSFTANKREVATQNIFSKYVAEYSLSDNPNDSEGIEGFTFKELEENVSGDVSAKNVRMQLEILKAFLHYKTIAEGLQSLSSIVNIDTKGNPKNMAGTIAKIDSISKISNKEGALANVDNYIARTIPGSFLHIPGIVAKLFMNRNNPVFAYNSDAYQHIYESMLEDVGKISLREEDMDLINTHVKQFVYSGFVFPDGEKSMSARQRLLFGDNSLQDRLVSLQNRFKDNNDWLDALKPVSSINVDNPKLIFLQATNEEDFMDKVSELWMSAIRDNSNPELQEFAKDMVKYAVYVAPQEFGLSSIMKAVPKEYLLDNRFGEYLNDTNKRTNYDKESNLNTGKFLVSHFGKQFAQHNVDYLKTVRVEKQAIKGSDTYERGVKNGRDIRVVLNSFKLPAITDDNSKNEAASLIRTLDNGKRVYPRFLAAYIDEIYKKQVYQGKVDNNGIWIYYRIDKLGSAESSEYNMGQDARTMFDVTSRSNVIIPSTAQDGNPILDAVESKGSVQPNTEAKRIEDTQDYLTEGKSPDDILSGIITKNSNIPASFSEANTKYAKLYQFLATRMIDRGLDRFSIVLDDKLQAAGFADAKSNIITFNPKELFKGRTGLVPELERQRTILHEFIHGMTYMANKNTKEFQAVQNVWEEYKKNIINTKEEVRGIQKGAFDATLFEQFKRDIDTARKNGDFGQNFIDYVDDVVSDDAKLTDLLGRLGTTLSKMSTEGKIRNANFDLIGNTQRLAEFKDYVRKEFAPNLKSLADKYYAYTNVNEFITEALTNKNVQHSLMNMKGILEKFIQTVRDLLAKIFGIEDEERNLFDDAVDSIFDFLKMHKDDSIKDITDLNADEIYQSNRNKLGFKVGKC